jgi:PP-loop superfamily ATP-utilizing enzyme
MKRVRYNRAAVRALYRHKNMRVRIEEKIAAYAVDPASMANMVKHHRRLAPESRRLSRDLSRDADPHRRS